MGVVYEIERSITFGRAERRGWSYGRHCRPAAHHSKTVLVSRIGMVEMEKKSRWLCRRLRPEAGVAAYDLRTQRAAMRGLLDAVSWHEGLLE